MIKRKIVEVKYGKKFNLGNYESEEISVVAVPEENESVSDLVETLKAEVHAAQAGVKTFKSEPLKTSASEKVEKGNTAGVKKPDKKPKAVKPTEPEEETEEIADVDTDNIETEEEVVVVDEDDIETGEEEEVVVDEEEEVVPAPKTSPKTSSKPSATTKTSVKPGQKTTPSTSTTTTKTEDKKKLRVKETTYSRVDETHKMLVGEILDENFPNWRVKLKAVTIQASKDMQGKEFLDKNGNVLNSFKDQLIKKIKKSK